MEEVPIQFKGRVSLTPSIIKNQQKSKFTKIKKYHFFQKTFLHKNKKSIRSITHPMILMNLMLKLLLIWKKSSKKEAFDFYTFNMDY